MAMTMRPTRTRRAAQVDMPPIMTDSAVGAMPPTTAGKPDDTAARAVLRRRRACVTPMDAASEPAHG
jgi:hypothetical protein